MAKKENRTFQLLFLVVQVIILAISFYFWEEYLSSHFLGGFDAMNHPIQHSHNGFHFFFHAWPLWLYPFIIGIYAIYFWKNERIRQMQEHMSKLEEHHIQQQVQLRDLQNELLTMKTQLANRTRNSVQLGADVHELAEAYDLLHQDYKQSLQFIEKLLDKLNQVRGKS